MNILDKLFRRNKTESKPPDKKPQIKQRYVQLNDMDICLLVPDNVDMLHVNVMIPSHFEVDEYTSRLGLMLVYVRTEKMNGGYIVFDHWRDADR